MQKIFFISDLHFGHTNIMKFSPKYRDFKSVEEMDEYLINLWNETVGNDDIVYDLGDFAFYREPEKIERTLKRLNGKHRLILGNHDKMIANSPSLQSLFDEISYYKFFKTDGFKDGVALFHYPIFEWQEAHFGSIHLYGHIHEKTANLHGRAINACYDFNGRFLERDEIINMAKKLDFSGFLHNKRQCDE